MLVTKILTAKARTVDDDGVVVEAHTGSECTVDKRSGPSSNSAREALRMPTPVARKLLTSERSEEKDEADNFSAVGC